MADESSFLAPLLRELTFGVDGWKKPVKVASTTNITLTGLQTVDGVLLGAGDEVVCVAQSIGAQNGIWVAAAGAWTRRFDATNSERLFAGVRVPVTHGTHAGDVYRLATTGKINVGITAQTWELDSQGGDEGPSADVDPTADTLALRGSAGEVKAASLVLTPGATRPTEAGQIYIDADGRVWAWSPYNGHASPLVAENEFPQYHSSRFGGGATTMTERPLTPLVDTLSGGHAVVVGHIIPEAALTADATNYATIRIYRRTGSTGGSQTLLAEARSTLVGTGATGNWTAFQKIDVFVDSLALPVGTYLTWEIVPVGGAPPTVPACTLYVAIARSESFPS